MPLKSIIPRLTMVALFWGRISQMLEGPQVGLLGGQATVACVHSISVPLVVSAPVSKSNRPPRRTIVPELTIRAGGAVDVPVEGVLGTDELFVIMAATIAPPAPISAAIIATINPQTANLFFMDMASFWSYSLNLT